MKRKQFTPIEESPLDPTKRQKSSRHRILVVDDSNSVRQLKVDLLVGSGYDVEEARDGADGWEALQTGHYDLIITDNTMPRMTGVEMIEKLRSASMTVPVIMATGLLPVFVFSRKPWLKPDVALTIPFSDNDLLAAVKRILDKDDGDDLPPATLLPKHL
ncbi:MAG: response regulator [Verrucomicrobiota bacterium]|jgi:CheY-like chemotaxis protein